MNRAPPTPKPRPKASWGRSAGPSQRELVFGGPVGVPAGVPGPPLAAWQAGRDLPLRGGGGQRPQGLRGSGPASPSRSGGRWAGEPRGPSSSSPLPAACPGAEESKRKGPQWPATPPPPDGASRDFSPPLAEPSNTTQRRAPRHQASFAICRTAPTIKILQLIQDFEGQLRFLSPPWSKFMLNLSHGSSISKTHLLHI